MNQRTRMMMTIIPYPMLDQWEAYLHLHKTSQNDLPALALRNLLNAWTNFTWRKFRLQFRFRLWFRFQQFRFQFRFQFWLQFQTQLLLHHLYDAVADNGNLQTKTKSMTVFYRRRLKGEQTEKNQCNHTFQSKPQNLFMMIQKSLVHLLLP
jgi:hypothetical protein